jgi:TRAP-type C4-dicarboxylate transport system permease large subunit
MLAVIIVVLGGIYGGVFTPTEAAGIGSFSTLVLLLLGKKGPREIKSSLLQTTCSAAMLFLVLIGAIVFSDFMTVSRLPKALVDALIGINLPPQAFLLMVLAMYIPLGCVMDAAPMLIVTLPFLLPMYELYNFNLIWMGVLMVRVMEMAMITPPIGMTVFVISGIAPDIPIQRIFRGIFPFLIADLLLLVLLATIPSISLFLPSTMMK